MTIMHSILSVAKYWKAGAIAIAVISFGLFYHLAVSRGDKVAVLEKTLKEERHRFQTQLKHIEQERQHDKERDIFRRSQTKKIKLAGRAPMELDDDLRDVYDRLRERQARTLSP